MQNILLLDNFDSFTFNLHHYLEASGRAVVTVKKNDNLDGLDFSLFDGFVISPGPGLPEDSPDLLKFLQSYPSEKKLLGVCLGMQAIATHYKWPLKNLEEVVHGEKRELFIRQSGMLFQGLPEKFMVGRYHSWVVDPSFCPAEFRILAHDKMEQIMAFEHKFKPISAVQFHPESILSDQGMEIIENWLDI